MRPTTLFHYTSVAGLKGIIESKTIWATDAQYLNDAQELQFGREELYEAMMAQAEKLFPIAMNDDGSAKNSMATILRSAAGQLKPGSSAFLAQTDHFVYVACFCEKGDLLSQWRAYGTAGGFAIGFKSEALAEAVLTGEDVHLKQVLYGEQAKINMVNRVVPLIAPTPRGHPGTSGYFQARRVAFPALAAIKNEAFAEEREWRLLVAGTSDLAGLNFRVGSLGLIPFVELGYDKSAVTEVVVGPGEHQELRKEAVSRLLKLNGFNEIKVRVSSAPFRG